MDAATWAFILLALGLIFLVLEFFIPSSGSLAVMCALSLMAAIGVGFAAGPWTGLSILITVAVVVPAALIAAVQWWPETPIGRMILIQRPKSSDEVLPETPAYRTFKDLVGRRGLAKGLMLPSGMVVIDGKSYEAVSEGTPIEAGQPILVVSISTQRLIVRPDNTIRAELAETPSPFADEPADVVAAAKVLAEPSSGESAPANPNEPLVQDIPDPFADEPASPPAG
ncbi:MAG TPA: NfeD family protein [Pirellulaceae bacterium]|nr:NfeD family protein [Pirellulaceae bacterium]